ncbi:MAG: thioredoxin family protein [Promethearchaeia archaeon]
MDLKWDDIKSPTKDTDEYLEYIKEKDDLIKSFEEYPPKKDILNQINNLLSKNNEEVKIFVIGADWCHDCAERVPNMTKIIKQLNNNRMHFEVLYGVKTNPFHKKDEPLWHREHSPPEATDPKFELEAIPTFYFFNKEGRFLGRIVEKPRKEDTLEEEMLRILKKNL